jgi:hypothetical protein
MDTKPVPSSKNTSTNQTPFTWGFPWTTEQPTNSNPAIMTNTKKVRITEKAVEASRPQSKFGRPKTTNPTFTNSSNSNSVPSTAQTPIEITNNDDRIKLIIGADNIIRSKLNTQYNKNTCCQAEPKQLPPQPNYPPPVYSDLPELVSDSESNGDKDEHPNPAKSNKQQTPNKNKGMSDQFNTTATALGQEFTDSETINGILTDMLGADMTGELENLADELVGTSGVTEPNEPKQAQPTATARELCIAYKALRKYANDVIKLNLYVDAVIFRYLQDMLRERLFDANILRRTTLLGNEKNFNQDTHKGVVKAICAELSISNKFSAIEDMIKNMPYSELMRFQKIWWFDSNDLPEQ